MFAKTTFETTDLGTPISDVRHVWDGFNVIAEISVLPSSVQTNWNVWGLDLSQTLQGAGGVGGLLSVTISTASTNSTFSTVFDANGNITEYIDATGAIVAHREYSPFGETTVLSGPMQNAFTHWWSTKPWDPITGFSEYEYRMYTRELGRWLSRDPIEEKGGLNIYGFANNAPINLLDYIGLQVQVTKIARGPNHINWVLAVYAEICSQCVDVNGDGVQRPLTRDELSAIKERIRSQFRSSFRGVFVDNSQYNSFTNIVVSRIEITVLEECPKELRRKDRLLKERRLIEIVNQIGGGDVLGTSFTMPSTHIRLSYQSLIRNPGSATLERTSAHEIGHSLGLWHPNHVQSVFSLNSINYSPQNLMLESAYSLGSILEWPQFRKIFEGSYK